MTEFADLKALLSDLRRWCDHDGEYQEPTPEKPWHHCDGIFCVRCGIEEANALVNRIIWPPADGPPSGRRPRLRECVEAWPDCSEGDYDPKCCRFPKSCSCTVYGDDTPAELLESRDGAPTCKHGTHKDSQCDDCFAEKGDDNNPFASQGSEER